MPVADTLAGRLGCSARPLADHASASPRPTCAAALLGVASYRHPVLQLQQDGGVWGQGQGARLPGGTVSAQLRRAAWRGGVPLATGHLLDWILPWAQRPRNFMHQTKPRLGALPRCRLPTAHKTLIRFSAPLFLDISYGSFGLSLGRTTTCSFVACMGKQVGHAPGGPQPLRGASGRPQPGSAAAPLLCLARDQRCRASLLPCCRSSRSSCWPRASARCGGWTPRCCAAGPCRSAPTSSP